MDEASYEDPLVSIHDGTLTIGCYYFPSGGAKPVRLDAIMVAHELRMTGWTGKWRIWGSSDLVHWFNLDGRRPGKQRAFVLQLGGAVNPVVTPDDPEAFRAALAAAGVPVAGP